MRVRKEQLAFVVVVSVVTGSLLAAGVGANVTDTPAGTNDEAVEQATTTAEESDFSIRNLSAPSRILPGENYTVSATLVNDGNASTAQRVVYRIAGNVIRSKLVLVPAGATNNVTFNVTEANVSGFPTGTFTHGVFTDEVGATANLTIASAAETTTAVRTTTPAERETTAQTATETGEVATATGEISTTTAGVSETTTGMATTTVEAPTANLTFENQTSNGTAVALRSVTVPEGGFVAIHGESIVRGNVTGSLLGASEFLEPGTHRNVTVELDESLNESRRLVAVAYRDSNDNRTFDFVTSNRTVDGPYTQRGVREAVNRIAFVTIEDDQ